MIGKSRRARWARRALVVLLVPLVVAGGYVFWTYHGPAAETEIYRGVVYCCQVLPDTPQSSGLVHWVRADLNVPGVSIFVTPLDGDAVAHGWEYRLQFTMSAVADQHLAAAVNGTMFGSEARWFGWPGDLARSVETLVADHTVNHVCPFCCLLGWDDSMMAHPGVVKPPTAMELAMAKWGVGSQMVALQDGKVNDWAGYDVNHRTLIGVDATKRLIWIACFDRASGRFAGAYLRDLGVRDAVMMDGGISTSMAIGAEAVGVKSGRVVGNWRPVATQFGFRAAPLAKSP